MSEVLRNLLEKRDEIQQLIDELMEDDIDFDVEPLRHVGNRVSSKPKTPKYETGIKWFDAEMNGGFTCGTFVNIAAESFAGKTTFVLDIMRNIAEYSRVLLLSFEMYEDLLWQKLKSSTGNQLDNFLIEQRRNDMDQVEKIIRKFAQDGGRFIGVDSRMKIQIKGKAEEYQKNSEISRRLSKLCQDLGVIIICINQISDADLKSGRLTLKGSGDQYYDSDVVLFITVGTDDVRKMYCTKDRVNGKKWSCIMPIPYVQMEETKYEFPHNAF